jgi:hypothetical protein
MTGSKDGRLSAPIPGPNAKSKAAPRLSRKAETRDASPGLCAATEEKEPPGARPSCHAHPTVRQQRARLVKGRKRAFIPADDWQRWLTTDLFAKDTPMVVKPNWLTLMCERDGIASDVLADLIYWHRPDSRGFSRLRLAPDGEQWRATSRAQLADRLGYSEDQIDRALAKLVRLRLIERQTWHVGTGRKLHVRVDRTGFNAALKDAWTVMPPRSPTYS